MKGLIKYIYTLEQIPIVSLPSKCATIILTFPNEEYVFDMNVLVKEATTEKWQMVFVQSA